MTDYFALAVAITRAQAASAAGRACAYCGQPIDPREEREEVKGLQVFDPICARCYAALVAEHPHGQHLGQD